MSDGWLEDDDIPKAGGPNLGPWDTNRWREEGLLLQVMRDRGRKKERMPRNKAANCCCTGENVA